MLKHKVLNGYFVAFLNTWESHFPPKTNWIKHILLIQSIFFSFTFSANYLLQPIISETFISAWPKIIRICSLFFILEITFFRIFSDAALQFGFFQSVLFKIESRLLLAYQKSFKIESRLNVFF